MRVTRRIVMTGAAMAAAAPAFAAGAKPAATAPAPLVLGALLPLSGDQSLVGDECLRGVQLAVDAINIAGGIGGGPILLITGDAYDQSAAPGAAQFLLGAGHAGLVLGSGASALSYPGSAVAELAQTPFIELNAPADGIMSRGFKFLLRTGLTTAMIAAVAIAALNQRFPARRVGLLFNTGATGGAIAAAALSLWAAAKTPPLLSIGYPADQVDLREPVSRMKRAGVEVILHAADGADVLVFFAALQTLGWRPAGIIGGGDGYMLRETAYALGNGLDGVLAVGAPFYPRRAAYLADLYTARYAMAPRSPDSLTAFVGARLVLDQWLAVNGDVSKLLDRLRGTDIAAGELANGWGVAFDKTGQNTRSFASLQQWRGGVLSKV